MAVCGWLTRRSLCVCTRAWQDYRKTNPHDGYAMLARWRDTKNAGPAAEEIREHICHNTLATQPSGYNSQPLSACSSPYDVGDTAGAFFLFTSNVDAHSFDYFKACEVCASLPTVCARVCACVRVCVWWWWCVCVCVGGGGVAVCRHRCKSTRAYATHTHTPPKNKTHARAHTQQLLGCAC